MFEELQYQALDFSNSKYKRQTYSNSQSQICPETSKPQTLADKPQEDDGDSSMLAFFQVGDAGAGVINQTSRRRIRKPLVVILRRLGSRI